MSPFEVQYGMVVLGDDGEHILVRGIDGPIPVAACWAPFRFTGPDLRTGRTHTVVARQMREVEVLPLPERVVEFVCKQGGELLLWDAEAGEMVGLPEAAHPVWMNELAPNTQLWARFYEGRPVWVIDRAELGAVPTPPKSAGGCASH